jgi:carbon-monoxide dehydrogenase iron sulfur subunit
MTVSEQTANEKKFVVADIDKCTGCGACELICALEKEKKFDSSFSRIKVQRSHQLVNIPVACRLCKNAPCVIACSRDALKQSEETGVIMIDDSKCDNCGWCIETCPYGAIMVHPEKKVVIMCDLCGGQPKCVDWCPEGALGLLTQKEYYKKARKATVNKLITETWR